MIKNYRHLLTIQIVSFIIMTKRYKNYQKKGGVHLMKRKTLIFHRKIRNKTQKEAAAELGISAIYLRKLESGTANPGRDVMINMERYYGVSMRDLFPDIFLPDIDTKCINK